MTDATALAAAIASGQTSAVAVMEASLAACQAHAALGAVVHIDTEMARDGAKAADLLPPDRRGLFHGVPCLAKDLGSPVKGLPVSAGSAALRSVVRPSVLDSALFKAFRSAGLVPFGVTASPPFGLALSCEPEGLPPARNPWDTRLSPGGSSGGAAAAVAAGIVAIAHATDAAGSIRVPAACCGLVGLKPSRGAIPCGPNFSNHLMAIASELVLARSVRDVKAAFEAVRLPLQPVALPDTARIALALPARCGPAQIAAARKAAAAMTDAGCTVFEVPAPDEMGADAHAIARKILSVSLAELLNTLEITNDQVPPLAAALATEGRAMPATELFAVAREMARVTDNAAALFTDADAVLAPVVSAAPPVVGAYDLTKTDVEAHFAQMEAFAPNAALANIAGLPSLALPVEITNGLPVGVQIMGPVGADVLLCELALKVEARLPALQFPHPIAGMPT